MILPGLSPAGTLNARSGEPFAMRVILTDRDGVAQDMVGRSFALAFCLVTQTEPFLTVDGYLEPEGKSFLIFVTAEQATQIYLMGRSRALIYFIVETTSGASTSRWQGSVSVAVGPDFPSEQPPVVAALPVSEAIMDATTLVAQERGATGDRPSVELFKAGIIDEPTAEAMNAYLRSAGIEGATPVLEGAEAARDAALAQADRSEDQAIRAEEQADLSLSQADRSQNEADRAEEQANLSLAQADRAEEQAARSELAASASASAGRLYLTKEDGEAVTPAGDIFYTQSPEDTEVAIVWRMIDGVAVDTGKRTPSATFIDAAVAEADNSASTATAAAGAASASAGTSADRAAAALSARDDSFVARDIAEAAAQTALLSGNIFADKSAGEAVTADGQQFVAYGPDLSYATRYLMVSGAGVAQDSYPNRAALDATQAAVDQVKATAQTAIPPGVVDQPDWIDLTVDSENRPVAGFDHSGRFLAAKDGLLSHIFGGNEARFVPLIDQWTDLTLDANGGFVSGVKTDGTEWAARAGRIVRRYGAGDVPSLVMSTDQSIPGVQVDDYAELTLDSEGRPVAGWDAQGRYLRADKGRMSHLFGGPDAGRAVPALGLWSELVVDGADQFVSGTKVDGSRWRARNGVVTRDYHADDLFIVAPLIDNWSSLTLDLTGRFVSGVKMDATRWIAQGGLIVRDGGSAGGGGGGGEMLTAIAAYGDSTTNGDQLDDDVTLTPDWRAWRWTSLLSTAMGLSIVNRGMNGHKTDQIAARAGGLRMSASVTGGSIPASGSVSLTNLSVADPLVIASGQDPYSFTVDLIADDGTAVRGVLTRTNSTTYSFARSVAGSAKTAATVDIVSVTGRTDMSVFAIIGSLTNDEPGNAGPALTTDQMNVIKANYRALVSAAKAGFLCWGPLDRGYQERAGTFNGGFIRDMEAWLRMEFGANFVDVRGYLASPRALADAAIVQPGFVPATNADPQLDDAASVAANTIPPSFRYGGVHLNALGHKLQARLFERILRARFDILIAA